MQHQQRRRMLHLFLIYGEGMIFHNREVLDRSDQRNL